MLRRVRSFRALRRGVCGCAGDVSVGVGAAGFNRATIIPTRSLTPAAEAEARNPPPAARGGSAISAAPPRCYRPASLRRSRLLWGAACSQANQRRTHMKLALPAMIAVALASTASSAWAAPKPAANNPQDLVNIETAWAKAEV